MWRREKGYQGDKNEAVRNEVATYRTAHYTVRACLAHVSQADLILTGVASYIRVMKGQRQAALWLPVLLSCMQRQITTCSLCRIKTLINHCYLILIKIAV